MRHLDDVKRKNAPIAIVFHKVDKVPVGDYRNETATWRSKKVK
jgi:hypothetical protein